MHFPHGTLAETGVFLIRRTELDMVDALQDIIQGSSSDIGLAPSVGTAEEYDILGIGDYHMREFQTLGLVDRHHPDGIRIGRGADLRFGFCPCLEEAVRRVAVGGDIVLDKVHEGLDVLGLGFETWGVIFPDLAQKMLAEVSQGEARDIPIQDDVHLAGDE